MVGSPFENKTLDELRYSLEFSNYPSMRRRYREAVRILSEIANIDETIACYERILKRSRHPIFTESSDTMGTGSYRTTNEQISENLVDIVGDIEEKASAGVSNVPTTGQREMLKMGEFLSRPVPLSDFSISVGNSLGLVAVPVWDIFTLDPVVRAKLRNYAYLKGNMKIRIAISGTPFHYGRLLLSYQPYPERNGSLQAHLNNLSLDPTWRPMLLNYLSQAPGAITMDVKANKPVEMTCPYISTKPMHRLFNTSTTAIGTSTSFDDLADCGTLYIISLNDIEAVSANASDISVYIYGWMEEVELGTSTATQVAILTESSIKSKKKNRRTVKPSVPPDKDERKTGPVERFASSAAKVSGMLTEVPYIGGLATASSIAFSGLSQISSLFGWSKPVIMNEPYIVKNMPYQNGALTIGNDTSMRIVLDQKQELTIDPSVCGVQDDDMVIQNISCRPTYLTTFSWAPSDAQLDVPIWQSLVSPNLSTQRSLTDDYFQPTAMAFAADPFSFWRGDITFRFEIVCSAYHRGKLAFYYDPNWSQNALINANLSTNKQFFKIVDIQETQLVEFTVRWAYPRAWSRTVSPPKNMVNPSIINASYADFSNGYIGVTPFTLLQSPDDSTIQVNCYVYSEDLQVNYFSWSNIQNRTRPILTESLVTESLIWDPEEISSLDLNDSSAQTDTICIEHFGEQPLSFRALLKRYSTNVLASLPVIAGYQRLELASPIIPEITLPYGMSSVPGTSPDILSYLRYAYLGMRGGVRRRVRMRNAGQFGQLDSVIVFLDEISDSQISAALTTSSTGILQAPMTGTVMYMPDSNAGVEFELPMYTNNLFLFSFADDLVGTNPPSDMEEFWVRNFYMRFNCNPSVTGTTTAMVDFATGEDFSLMRYQGAPYYYKT